MKKKMTKVSGIRTFASTICETLWAISASYAATYLTA